MAVKANKENIIINEVFKVMKCARRKTHRKIWFNNRVKI